MLGFLLKARITINVPASFIWCERLLHIDDEDMNWLLMFVVQSFVMAQYPSKYCGLCHC